MRARRAFTACLAGLLSCAAQVSLANVKGRVIVEPAVDGPAWVGEQVAINLDLKTTGYSFSDTRINLPRVDGGFLMQVDTTTIKLTEIANGESWQVIRYPLALFPQRAGIIRIPPIRVRFSSTSAFGQEPREFDLQTQTLSLSTRMPPGLEPDTQALVVSTASFELNFSWKPAAGSDQAEPGDALSLSVTRRASGISGMLLDPLPVFRAEGLGVYPEAPQVQDRVDRGDLTGVRTDRVTWIVEQPGSYQWPDIDIQWWDPAEASLRRQSIPGPFVEVAGAPSESAGASEPPTTGKRAAWWMLVAPLLLAGLGWWVWRRFGHRLRNVAPALSRGWKSLTSVYHLPPLNPRD